MPGITLLHGISLKVESISAVIWHYGGSYFFAQKNNVLRYGIWHRNDDMATSQQQHLQYFLLLSDLTRDTFLFMACSRRGQSG